LKRYRHYKKDRAIVLSCFGSIIEQDKYIALKKDVKKRFSKCDVFLAFSSRMVLKRLKKEKKEFKNLPQTLADVDMLGYKNIIVASINLFPTDEHKVVKKIATGFNLFSPSNIRVTNAILTKTKDTTLFLKELDGTISKDGVANLYVIHGTPRLDTNGIDSITYSANFLEQKRLNYSCSLEGAYPWYGVKETIIKRLKSDGVKKVQIVPMLLVSGNHYINDMVKIKDELSSHFESSLVESISESERFNLLELKAIREIIYKNIEEEMIKLGC
jgi:sirohydrochlorin cobaltochelatase